MTTDTPDTSTPASSETALPETRAGWHRRVWKLTWPIVISNLSIPLLGAVDTAVVGHLDEPTYLGAVAIGAVIFNFIYWGFGFLKMSTTGFSAQAFGGAAVRDIPAAPGSRGASPRPWRSPAD